MKKDFEVFLGDGSQGIKQELENARQTLAGVKWGYETAVMRALNRSAITGRSEIVKATRRKYTVKAKPVRQAIRLEEKATYESLETMLTVRSTRLALEHFKFTPKSDTTGGARKPVKVAVKRGVAPKPIKNAFVHKGRILQRTGTTSTPLIDMTGPSAPSMVGNASVTSEIETAMRAMFLKRLDHEIVEVLRSGALANHWQKGGKIHGRD